jgi:hypothetical protein
MGNSDRANAGRIASVALAVARAAHAQWFFVNLYEAVVRMPDRLADEHDSGARQGNGGPFRTGSPARYHIPAVPVVVASTAIAVADGLRTDRDRAALLVAAACSSSGIGLTGYLVRRVNLRLLDDGPPIGPEERRSLMGRWYRLNGIRLLLLAAASVAFDAAARRRQRHG